MSSPFKAYDIRGRFPSPLSPELAHALGVAIARVFEPKNCVVGLDARLSGPALREALSGALENSGVSLTSLGQCGTEEIYNAAANGDFDLGIMITGSHNPADENGFKLVRRGAIPIGHDSGLRELEKITAQILANGNALSQNNTHAAANDESKMPETQLAEAGKLRGAYLDWLVKYSGINEGSGRKLRVAADAGCGCAGLLLEPLSGMIRHELMPIDWQPDGTFPHGVPNPLLPGNHARTSAAVIASGADLGVAFDGDFDRCFFYDQEGNFIEGYYLVGLLASVLLKKFPGEKIIHDTRVYWNTEEVVKSAGGIPIMGKTGHAFMKGKMRGENALYGGEMSAHHYFRDFAFCDSGMLAMLLVLSLLQHSRESLAEILQTRMQAFPCSGEINFRTPHAGEIMEGLRQKYDSQAVKMDELDGINLEMPAWRFNLRTSNTEPLLRLNLETRGDASLLKDRTAEISEMILANGAMRA